MNETLKKKFEEMKAKYPDTVLFFRVGDFYESYGEDAEVVAKELGITLTSAKVFHLILHQGYQWRHHDCRFPSPFA